MVCHIVGAGECPVLPQKEKEDLLIAADGGLDALSACGILPDLLIGDFDSLKSELPNGTETVRLPVEKDETDMEAAVRLGLARGYREFAFYGATGGRPDHTYGNYRLLISLVKRGMKAVIHGDYSVSAVKNGTLMLPKTACGTVSVFAVDAPAEGVTLKGLYYPLENAVLDVDTTLGVSNHVVAHPASVSVRQGCLFVMWEH